MTQPPTYAPGPAPVPAAAPGKTLGIVGLVLAFLAPVIGLILSIVALLQSKKAGLKNTPAMVGVILGAIFTVIAIIVIVGAVAAAGSVLAQCQELGPGIHEVNGMTITCG